MRILPSPLVEHATGAHGTLVFKSSPQGAIAQGRPRRLPAPTSTSRLQLYSLARLQNEWHALTISARADWNRYAAGLSISANSPRAHALATGWACFAANNIQRRQFNLATLTTPPQFAAFNAPINAVLSKGGSGQYLVWNVTPDPILSGEHMLITRSPRTSNATNTAPRHAVERYSYPGPYALTGAWFFASPPPSGVSYFFTVTRISTIRMPSMTLITKILW